MKALCDAAEIVGVLAVVSHRDKLLRLSGDKNSPPIRMLTLMKLVGEYNIGIAGESVKLSLPACSKVASSLSISTTMNLSDCSSASLRNSCNPALWLATM